MTTQKNLRKVQENQMERIGKEIGIALHQSYDALHTYEELVAENLRLASLLAHDELPADAALVTNEQLIDLSSKLGVSHITLFQPIDDDFIAVKSSDPREIGLRTHDWGYWNDAFHQLINHQKVTIPRGLSLPNYWAGPYDDSDSNPDTFAKYGYYYDKTTNYILNPYIEEEDFDLFKAPKNVISQTLRDNDVLLEITVFNPNTFGKMPLTPDPDAPTDITPTDRPINFGSYEYQDPQDVASTQQAYTTGKIVTFTTESNGKKVLKSFIPLQSEKREVVSVVTDYTIISQTLHQQLIYDLIISIATLFVVLISSYMLAGYIVKPVQNILRKVNDISNGNFDIDMKIGRSDELGSLDEHINKMSRNLQASNRELHAKNQQILYQAYHDPLTNLPNRRLFTETLLQVLATDHDEEHQAAVMFVDLDRFKNINDSLGHNIGDALLLQVAVRLCGVLQDQAQIYRVGGDEFTILLSHVRERQEATTIAQTVIHALATPFSVDGYELYVSPSIGISFYPADGSTMDILVKNADTAMYIAKDCGGNTYRVYDPVMNESAVEQMTLESQLRKAIERDELRMYYQPKYDLRSGRISGMEALVRWYHQDRGFISPGKFIPLAEESGLIAPIGEWILNAVCKQNKAWQDAGYQPMRVAVNLSPRQFQHHNLIRTVTRVLEETGLSPEWLEIEITENVLLHNTEEILATLQTLKEMGIHISIDDFGTGFSSLNYLKRFPIDSLKIDQSFVRDITVPSANKEIISAVIRLGHSLQLNVIAEGVENEEELDFLRNEECDQIQGYLFSRPLPVEEFEALMERGWKHTY